MASEIIERKLYNDEYHMVHNPNARGRSPRYLVNGKLKPKGVTTILGATLAKDLISWALGCMEEALMEKLPVITEEDVKWAKGASGRKRDGGASTGSEAHALVEDFLKGKQVSLEDSSDEAKNAYNAFIDWFNTVKPEVINVEEVVYSPTYEYAGTYDCTLEIDGKVYLCDLKTTNASRTAPKGVYAEHFIQLGSYASAHEEQRLFELGNLGTKLRKIDGVMVISAKKNGKLHIVTNEDLGLTVTDCIEMAKKVINIYRFMTSVTNKLGLKKR